MSVINWYQTIPELGIKGRYDTPKEFDKIGLPEDLHGKTVLDIGCNSGAFMAECLKRGARYVSGIEPNPEWRIVCGGTLLELGWHPEEFFIDEAVSEYGFTKDPDIVLLLSVLHLDENPDPQPILNDAWKRTKELLIVEINDRLQKVPIKLPKGAVKYGTNKDNRTVWHCYKGKNKRSKGK